MFTYFRVRWTASSLANFAAVPTLLIFSWALLLVIGEPSDAFSLGYKESNFPINGSHTTTSPLENIYSGAFLPFPTTESSLVTSEGTGPRVDAWLHKWLQEKGQKPVRRSKRTSLESRKNVCAKLEEHKKHSELGEFVSDIASPLGLIGSVLSTVFKTAGRFNSWETDREYIDNDCDDVPFEELREYLGERFGTASQNINRNFGAIQKNLKFIGVNYGAIKSVDDKVDLTLRSVTKGFYEVARKLGETQMDIKEGFRKLREFIRETILQEDTFKLTTSIEYFLDKKGELEQLSREERVRRLALNGENILGYFKTTTTPHSATTLHTVLHTILNRLNHQLTPGGAPDETTITALYLACLGTETYIDLVTFLVKGYQYLASYSQDKADVENYSNYITMSEDIAKEYANSLNGERGLITRVINTIALARGYEFLLNGRPETADFLSEKIKHFRRLQSEITSMQIHHSKPSKLIRFNFGNSTILTPLLGWQNGRMVRYALQIYSNGSYSKVGDWSGPSYIAEKGCPLLDIGKASPGTIRLIFRKFDNDQAKFVGAVVNPDQSTFRDINRDLYDAAREANEEAAQTDVQTLLRHGAAFTARFEKGRQAIHAAALSGNKQVTQILLNRGADVNVQDSKGYTSLHIAVETGHEHLAKHLIMHGADVNIGSNRNWTALHKAADMGDQDTLETLLNVTTLNINAKTLGGFTALHLSARKEASSDSSSRRRRSQNFTPTKKRCLVSLLRDGRMDVNAQSEAESTPLHLAILDGDQDAVESLLDIGKCDVNLRAKGGFTALHLAAISGNELITLQLLKRNLTDVNAISSDGWSSLHLATSLGQRDITFLLLNDSRVNANLEGKDQMTSLHLASAMDRAEIVGDLLNRGADIHKRDIHNYTCLHYAAERADVKLVRLLVGKGADIYATEEHGYTSLEIAVRAKKLDVVGYLADQVAEGRGKALMYAIELDSGATVKYLIETLGVDIHAEGTNGMTPLMDAIIKGKQKVTQYLMEACADVNKTNHDQKTCLNYAIESGNVDLVKTLLERDAGLSNHSSIFLYAVEKGNLDIVKHLVEKRQARINQNDDKRSTIFCAVKSGNVGVVKYLVDKGCDMKVKGESGQTALHSAAKASSFAIVEYLIRKGADVNEKDYNGSTVLHYAVAGKDLDTVTYREDKSATTVHDSNGNKTAALYSAALSGSLPIVKFLVSNGAIVNVKDVNGFTPLLYAAKNKLLDIVKYLVEEQGANVNESNNVGATALFLAAREGNLAIVRYLVSKRANVKVKDKSGRTLLHGAVAGENLDIIKYLVEEQGANVNETDKYGTAALYAAAEKGNFAIVRYLVSKRANVEVRDKFGSTLLRGAVAGKNLDIVKYLVEEQGTNVQETSNGGRSALFFAAREGNLAIVRYLVSKGVNAEVKDKSGRTLLHGAVAGENLDIVKYLVEEQGANVNETDNGGRSALFFAAREGNFAIVRYLVSKRANVEVKDNFGRTLLHDAVEEGNLDIVKYLVEEHVANMQKTCDDVRSVVYTAARKENLAIVEYLQSKCK